MEEPSVNVAIMHSPKVEFILYGDYKSDDLDKMFNGKYSAELVGGQIKLSNEERTIPVKDDFLLSPIDPKTETFLLKDVIIGVQFHWEQKQNQRFSGAIRLIIKDEKITVINVLPVEDYLKSVISSEMSPTSSNELLKAHAIISRSWLLAQINKQTSLKDKAKYKSEFRTENEIIKWYDREDHINYDVCADDHCQRYQGVTKTHAHNAEIAVKETRGFVLMYNDSICDARYSKSCGGISEVFENVWEDVKHPYLQNVLDYKFEPDGYDTNLTNEENAVKWIENSPNAFCNTKDEKILDQVLNDYDRKTKDFFRWKVQYTQEEISKLIHEKSGIDFGDIIDFIPVERGFSGRLIKLKIIGTKRTMIIGKELEIRKLLSKTHLYSSAIVFQKLDLKDGVPNKFILKGAGWGHGVGLCQIGAAVMGEWGYRFDEILLHYFRGAKIKKIYE